MARIHFGTFLELVEKKYKGNGKGAKASLASELQSAKITGIAFDDLLQKVRDYASDSSKAEGLAFKWRNGDINLEASFHSDKGEAVKAAAFHFYFLAHDEYARRAKALNEVIDLSALMHGKFETAVFGFSVSPEADATKRVHPIPPRPTAPFHWPLYVQEEDAKSPDADVGVWLNPLNHFSIPLSHRQLERDILNKFIEDDRRFLICALVAPSGAGKTRLVSEWMRKFAPEVSDTDWDAGFVTDRNPEPWQGWEISRNTLIVIDYTYAYDDVMRAIAERCRYHRGERAKKVRLLVIDHVYPQALQSDFFWSQSFVDQGHIDSRKNIILFEKSPVELHPEKTASPFLREVIAATASSEGRVLKPNDPAIIDAEAVLSKMSSMARGGNPEAVRHPLFAALLGQVIREGGTDYKNWTRRDLIKHYFDKPSRLPWRQDKEGEGWGIWIGAYVAVATLLRGVPFATLRGHLRRPSLKNRNRFAATASFIEQAANRLVSSSDREALKPLEPDILGENFLIQFFKEINLDDEMMSSFAEILAVRTEVHGHESAILNFLETLQRLVRNLLNDDQTVESVTEAWEILDSFLQPEHFPHGTLLRQAISIVRADIVRQSREGGNQTQAAQFANTIDYEDVQEASAGPIWQQAAVAFMHYFDWKSRHAMIKDTDIATLTRIGSNYRERSELNPPVLMLPVLEGCLEAARAVWQELGDDINGTRSDGLTILMSAASEGRPEIVQWLIDNGADPKIVEPEEHVTALWAACAGGHTETVAVLLRAGADINERSSDIGWTALMIACGGGHTETAALLLREGAEANLATSRGWTALMSACLAGHTETAALLLDEGAKIDQAIDDGQTALMVACKSGHAAIVDLLLSKKASLDVRRSDYRLTALMSASAGGYTEIVDLLLQGGAEVDKGTADDGQTALMFACMNGHTKTAELLLKHGAAVNEQTKDGRTALVAACVGGHVATAALLLKNGATEIQDTADVGARQVS